MKRRLDAEEDSTHPSPEARAKAVHDICYEHALHEKFESLC